MEAGGGAPEVRQGPAREREMAGPPEEALAVGFGAGQGPARWVAPGRLAMPSSCGVRVLDADHTTADSGLQENFWGEAGRGVPTALTVCPRIGCVAFAQRGLPAAVRVAAFPELEERAVLEVGDPVEYLGLAFSADGEYLLAARGVEDFQLDLWDWQQESIVASLPLDDEGPCDLSFFPLNPEVMVCVGELCVQLLVKSTLLGATTLHKFYVDVDDVLLEGEKLSCHAWDSDGALLLGTSVGRVLSVPGAGSALLDSPSLPCIALFLGQSLQALGQGVSCLCITRTHVIVATSEGEMQWFDREEQECVHSIGLPCKNIISLDINPNYDCFAVTSSDGGLFLVEMEDADPLSISTCTHQFPLFHTQAVEAVFPVLGGRFMTVGREGQVTVWTGLDSDTVRVEQQLDFDEAVSTVAMSSRGPLLALGFESGLLELLPTLDGTVDAEFPLFSGEIQDNPVENLAFNHDGTIAAFVDRGAGRVNLLRLEADGIGLVGYFKIKGVTCLAWVDVGPREDLVVALPDGSISFFDVPPGVSDDIWRKLDRKSLQRGFINVPSPASAILDTWEGKMVLATTDNFLRMYSLPKDGNFTKPCELLSAIEIFQMPGNCIRSSLDGTVLAVGAQDGFVYTFETDTLEPLDMFCVQGAQNGGCKSVAVSPEGTLLMGSGCGTVNILLMQEDTEFRLRPARGKFTERLQLEDSGTASEEEGGEADEASGAADREGQTFALAAQDKLYKIEAVLENFKANNKKCDPLEKLESADFIIDWNSLKRSREETAADIAAMRADHTEDILRSEVMVEKIKKLTHDTCDVQWKAIVALDEVAAVPPKPRQVENFPVRTLEDKEKNGFRYVKFLRTVEKLEGQFHEEMRQKLAEESAENTNTEKSGKDGKRERRTSVFTEYVKVQEPVTFSKGGVERTDPDEGVLRSLAPEESNPQKVEHNENGIEEFTYGVFSLRSNVRKRIQKVLIEAHNWELQSEFNEEFEKLHSLKCVVVDKIAEKVVRMNELYSLLGVDSTYVVPALKSEEIPGSVLEVREDEIGVEKVLSASEQLKEEAGRKEREEAKLKAQANNSTRRALEDMMHGSLERQEKSAMDALVRQPWMDLREEELSPEQQQELQHYNRKLAEILEEQAMQTKIHEAELRQLKIEVEELETTFDEELFKLFQKRVSTEYAMSANNLRKALLLNNIESVLTGAAQLKEIESSLHEISYRVGETHAFVNEMQRAVYRRNKEHVTLLAKDKSLEKSFKREFSKYEAFFEDVQEAYRNRPLKTGAVPLPDGMQGRMTRAKKRAQRLSIFNSGGRTTPMMSRAPLSSQGPRGSTPSTPGRPGSPNRPSSPNRPGSANRPGSPGILGSPHRPNSGHRPSSGNRRQSFGSASLKSSESGQNSFIAGMGPLEAGLDPYSVESPAIQPPDHREYMHGPADCPEGLDQSVWERVLEARDTKVRFEERLSESAQKLETVSKEYDRRTRESEELKERQNQMLHNQQSLEDACKRRVLDADLFLPLKQGLVEVDQGAVVTDYSDATLLHREEIEKLNVDIQQHGWEKVEMLRSLQDDKRDKFITEWNSKHCDFVLEDISAKLQEVQLLRVTKKVQQALKTGGVDTVKKKEEIALQRQIFAMETGRERAIFLRQISLADVGKKMEDKARDQKRLKQKLAKEREGLEGREALKEKIKTAGEENSLLKVALREKKSQNTRLLTKLRKRAQAQREEIILRERERNELRGRVHPDFKIDEKVPPDLTI